MFPPAGQHQEQGWGPCVKCGESARGRKKSSRAEAAFRIRLAELEAELLKPLSRRPRTAPGPLRAGHECHPRPSSVTSGRQGICRTCAGNHPAVTEAAFRARLAEAGATLLEPVWLGMHTQLRIPDRIRTLIPIESEHRFRSFRTPGQRGCGVAPAWGVWCTARSLGHFPRPRRPRRCPDPASPCEISVKFSG